MILSQLQSGEAVFLDANVLVYHFEPHPVFGPPCNLAVSRIERQDLLGYSSTHALTELAHRLMMMEASALPGWVPAKVKHRLRQQPTALANLTRFRVAITSVLQSRIQILTIAPALVDAAAAVSQQTGLLSNDALVIAVMQANGLTNLASNDADFDRVPGITRYAPV
jgi:predicted nucleic acid-binding protein